MTDWVTAVVVSGFVAVLVTFVAPWVGDRLRGTRVARWWQRVRRPKGNHRAG